MGYNPGFTVTDQGNSPDWGVSPRGPFAAGRETGHNRLAPDGTKGALIGASTP